MELVCSVIMLPIIGCGCHYDVHKVFQIYLSPCRRPVLSENCIKDITSRQPVLPENCNKGVTY